MTTYKIESNEKGARELLTDLKETVARSYGDGVEQQSSTSACSSAAIDLRLGNLLIALGMVSEDVLEQSLETSCQLNIPVGRILVMSGWITDRQLRWMTRLQSLLKDSIIDLDTAGDICMLMDISDISFEDALEAAGFAPAHQWPGVRLGELLVDAGIIQEHNLEEAIQKADRLGLPFGRCLVLAGCISESMLATAVNAQRFVRQGKIERDDAVCALAQASKRQKNEPEKLHVDPSPHSIRLGELLVLAGIVTEAQVLYAVEVGLTNNLPVGEVLKDLGVISDQVLENVLLVQSMVAHGTLEPRDAASALIAIHYQGLPISQAVSSSAYKKVQPRQVDFRKFLASTGLISKKAIDGALEAALASSYFVGKALVLAGSIDERSFQNALCCHFYINEGMLTFEESVMVFDHSQRLGLPIDETLEELGMALRKRPGSRPDTGSRVSIESVLSIA